MWKLCEDVSHRMEVFQHIDMNRVVVAFAQARKRVTHGLQAKLTPMRFENGSLTERRGNRTWTVQRVFQGDREMLYILTFYLPRFFDLPFREKMITVLHELFHIGPNFDGDYRRMGGRYHVHTASEAEYDRLMAVYVDEYLGLNPPMHLLEFLTLSLEELQKRYSGIVGTQIRIPKLIPVDVQSA